MMRKNLRYVLLVSVLLVSCSPGKLFGPTYTPTFTITLTPTFTSSPTLTPTLTATPTPEPTITPSPTPIGGGSGKIIFVYKKDGYKKVFPDLQGNANLFMVNIDGSGLTPLTSNGINTYSMSGLLLSPNGQRLLYWTGGNPSDLSGYGDLYLLDLSAMGSPPQRITSTYWGGTEAWVDDSHIVYTTMFGGKIGLYIMNIDGTGKMPLSVPDEAGWPMRIRSSSSAGVIWEGSFGGPTYAWPRSGLWHSPVDGSIADHLFDFDNHGEFIISDDGTKIITYGSEGLQYADLTKDRVFRNLSVDISGYIYWLPGNSKVIIIPSCGNLCDPPYNTTSGYILSIEDLIKKTIPVPDYKYYEWDQFLSCISPDGKIVIYSSSDYLKALDLDTMMYLDNFLSGIDISQVIGYEMVWAQKLK